MYYGSTHDSTYSDMDVLMGTRIEIIYSTNIFREKLIREIFPIRTPRSGGWQSRNRRFQIEGLESHIQIHYCLCVKPQQACSFSQEMVSTSLDTGIRVRHVICFVRGSARILGRPNLYTTITQRGWCIQGEPFV